MQYLSSIENNLGSLRLYQRRYGHSSKNSLDSFTSHQEWHSHILAIKTSSEIFFRNMRNMVAHKCFDSAPVSPF